MFRHVILIVLFLHVYVHVDGRLVFDNLKIDKMLLQNAAVPKMTVCVTFGALRCGAKFRHICVRSDYATFCTISATAVREMTVCVTFGASHFGFFVATWGHPAVHQTGGVLLGTGFR